MSLVYLIFLVSSLSSPGLPLFSSFPPSPSIPSPFPPRSYYFILTGQTSCSSRCWTPSTPTHPKAYGVQQMLWSSDDFELDLHTDRVFCRPFAFTTIRSPYTTPISIRFRTLHAIYYLELMLLLPGNHDTISF